MYPAWARLLASPNAVNGVPASANVHLLETLGRQTFGFEGFYTSDCDAIYEMQRGHGWRPAGSAGPVDEITRHALEPADLHVVVLSARQPLATTELATLRILRGLHRERILVFIDHEDELRDPQSEVRNILSHVRQTLAREFPSDRGVASAVDLACHQGWFSAHLAQAGFGRVLGVDARPEHVADASLIRDALSLPQWQLLQSDVHALDTAALGTHDLVLCFGLIYHLENPVGALRVASSERGLCYVGLPREAGRGFEGWLVRHAPGARRVAAWAPNQKAVAQLVEFLEGKRRVFDLALDVRGTPFQRAVWEALLAIPYGETRSYGEIARAIGHPEAARGVGAANAANPIALVVPCHRVIGADGSLTGYGGGLPLKKALLAHEAEHRPRAPGALL